jgi:mannitol/fructose-specific phosphotransferase system IIA component (Ntr-type)
MTLADVFDEKLIKLNLEGGDKNGVFEEMVKEISTVRPDLNKEEMLKAIRQREEKISTSIAPGVAVPHGYFHDLDGIVGAIGFSRNGIEYDTPDKKPVHLVFLFLIGENAREQHLHILSRILTFVKSGALSYIHSAETPQKAYDILCKAG